MLILTPANENRSTAQLNPEIRRTTITMMQTMKRIVQIEQEGTKGPKILNITYITPPRVLLSNS